MVQSMNMHSVFFQGGGGARHGQKVIAKLTRIMEIG